LEQDLTTNLCILQSHLDGMLNRLQQNSLTLKRFQAFEMNLLNLNSLAEMIDQILQEAKDFFMLDIVSLCLVDEKGEIAGFLQDNDYPYQEKKGLILLDNRALLTATFGLSLRPFLGSYKQSNCSQFFPELERKPASVAILPLTRRGKYLGSFNFGSYTSNRFIDDMATDFIEHMVSVVSVCLENNLNFEMMRRTSLVDTLTGVNNRRFLEQRIGEELDRSQRDKEPLACLFLDIDHFKQVNDNYGHQAGDYILTQVARVIKKMLRNNDVLARYGGEEFVALLSNIDQNRALDIAERIRESIKQLTLTFDEQAINVTISIGLSIYLPSYSPKLGAIELSEQLIHSADSALYQAKNSGRDRVVIGTQVLDSSEQMVS